MKLEQQVVSLDLAKKLKELGVKQEGHFRWHDEGKHGAVVWEDDGMAVPLGVKTFSAFTVAELGEMLPKRIELEDCGVRLSIEAVRPFVEFEYLVKYYGEHDRNQMLSEKYDKVDKNMANALAKMLIYLLEHKIIEL